MNIAPVKASAAAVPMIWFSVGFNYSEACEGVLLSVRRMAAQIKKSAQKRATAFCKSTVSHLMA